MKQDTDTYPQQSKVRTHEINELKARYEQFPHSTTAATTVKLRKPKKPSTVGEMIKEFMEAVRRFQMEKTE